MKKILLFFLMTSVVACSVDNDELNTLDGEKSFAANKQADECFVDAGEDNSVTYTNSYVDERVNDFGQVRILYMELLDESVSSTGTFNPSLRQLFRAYNRNNYGDFTTTYTVGEGDCTDSVELTISICDEAADAGSDNSISVTETYLDEVINDVGQIDDLYLDLLDEDVDRSGTLNPTGEEIYRLYLEGGVGEYTTTYTLGEGSCSDTAELTINITCDDIDAGSNNSITLTQSYIEQEINDMGQIDDIYLDLLDEGVDRSGTLNPTAQDIYRRYVEEGVGEYTTTYTLGEGNCSDTAELTINITCDDIDAGSDNSITLTQSYIEQEINDMGQIDDIYLDLLDAGVDRSGTLNPTGQDIYRRYVEEGVGEYSTTYTLGEGDCIDNAELTIIVTE